MTMQLRNGLDPFAWEPQPMAERLVNALVDDFCRRCPAARRLAARMHDETGTRLIDWTDHLAIPGWTGLRRGLEEVGYTLQPDEDVHFCFRHDHGVFPPILIIDRLHPMRLAIRVESVADFAAANRLSFSPSSTPPARIRTVIVSRTPQVELLAVERHGYRGFGSPHLSPEQKIRLAEHVEQFRLRRREFKDEVDGFDHAECLIDRAVGSLGRDLACDLFFSAEREYWQRRNTAARVQKARQDRLGLGWANHDHHTYRSSRRHFWRLIRTWESLGFVCRERFYAGREAGWGAQVCEHPVTGIVTFNDVDLAPEEVAGDFAHEPLGEWNELGTVGLWCGLHGESFLQAGMHHLECQFDFDALREQLEVDAGVKTMAAFTDLPHLKQAFTEGERWAVSDGRIAGLLERGQITAEQAKQFHERGAIGSHLENLQRNAGFKGFNQKGINEIIAATDPRRHLGG